MEARSKSLPLGICRPTWVVGHAAAHRRLSLCGWPTCRASAPHEGGDQEAHACDRSRHSVGPRNTDHCRVSANFSKLAAAAIVLVRARHFWDVVSRFAARPVDGDVSAPDEVVLSNASSAVRAYRRFLFGNDPISVDPCFSGFSRKDAQGRAGMNAGQTQLRSATVVVNARSSILAGLNDDWSRRFKAALLDL